MHCHWYHINFDILSYCLTDRGRIHCAKMPKRKAYSVEQKLEAIARVRKGESQAVVSRDNGVPESTLRGWLKDEEKLKDFVHTLDESDGMKRKKAKTAKDPELDKAMFNWFVQERNAGTPLCGPVVVAQAKKMSQTLHGENDDFLGTKGWLYRFQKRHGIR